MQIYRSWDQLSLKLDDFDAEHFTSISQLYTTETDQSFESFMIMCLQTKSVGNSQRNPAEAVRIQLGEKIVRSESERRVGDWNV